MRNMKKWLVLLLAVVMLMSNLSITAAATENWAPVDLETRPAEGGILQVDILATEGSIVADGKLVLTYDPAVLTYEGTEISTAWNDANAVTLSINDKNGKLILAFASAEAADEGVLFSVRFSGAVSDTRIELVGRDSYIGSAKVPAIGGEYCPADQFVDIRNSIPMIHEAVDYMVGMGYMNGMDASHFGPNLELNRAMMVTILYRIAGSPAVEADSTFADVPAEVFYTAPVAWAVENGITNGVSSSLFAPGKSLTRQELVKLILRGNRHRLGSWRQRLICQNGGFTLLRFGHDDHQRKRRRQQSKQNSGADAPNQHSAEPARCAANLILHQKSLPA